MIRPLRSWHRWIWRILALGLPIGFVVALRTRPVDPGVASLPFGDAVVTAEWDTARSIAWDALALDVQLARAGAGRRAVRVTPRRDLEAPELLLYWHASPRPRDTLPEDAWLLGALAGHEVREFAIPEPGIGTLYVYSLGHATLLSAQSLAESP